MVRISCLDTPDYDEDVLYEKISAHFAALGIENDITAGMRVLIKPNLLSEYRPERAVTTHPSLVAAIAKWLVNNGVNDIVVADSPGGPYISAALRRVYAASGYTALADRVRLNYDTKWRGVDCADGFLCRSYNIIDPIPQADYIINAAKLKTHGMTVLSAGIKNMFGVIPGLQKPELHYRFTDSGDFARMLVELAQTVTPDLTVLDAVECMEGDGPSGGKVRRLELTLASKNVFALDWFAASLAGIDQSSVPMLKISKDKGLIEPDKIEIIGSFTRPERPFLLPKSIVSDLMAGLPRLIQKPVGAAAAALLKPYPKVIRAKCTGCARCAQSCPAQIITMKNKLAKIAKKGCISCFCCQEMCKSKAIEVKRRLRL